MRNPSNPVSAQTAPIPATLQKECDTGRHPRYPSTKTHCVTTSPDRHPSAAAPNCCARIALGARDGIIARASPQDAAQPFPLADAVRFD